MRFPRKAKVNISRAMYDQIVDEIEHDPLIRHSTLLAAVFVGLSAALAGLLLWYVQLHPAKLVRTHGTVTMLNSGKTDSLGTVTTFITFAFTTHDGRAARVKAPVNNGHTYHTGDTITVGYSPLNPNYARNLSHISPPRLSIVLWSIPPLLIFWFAIVALARHHERQLEIWAAAAAAKVDAE